MKSGSLNLMEPPGPVQACNGIALLLPFVLPPINGCKIKGYPVFMFYLILI
jgi:hypothetical protein